MTLEKCYQTVFATEEGQVVLADLERIVNSTKIDNANPNVNSALWKCAQHSLLQRIHNQLAKP